MDELEIERRLSHIEERAKSNTRRIDEVEKKQEDITDLIQSVATIAQKQTAAGKKIHKRHPYLSFF